MCRAMLRAATGNSQGLLLSKPPVSVEMASIMFDHRKCKAQLLLIICFSCLLHVSTGLTDRWVESKHLNKWYNPFDLCMIHSGSNSSIKEVIKECETKTNAPAPPPVRCQAGNSWPSKSEYCSAADIPFNQRMHFQRSVEGLDDPGDHHLKRFFAKLSEEEGTLVVVGDSVMQQYFSAIACELEREQVWKDHTKFSNTDEVQYVRVAPNATLVPMQFLPIYHFVNGRHDRIPNAPMRKLESTLEALLPKFKSIVVVVNMGLHYIDNPVPNFSRIDYRHQMTTALTYLHNFALSHLYKNIRVFWRETSAQHFPTANGYWPGAKYASVMKLTCVPHKDTSSGADWRNREIEDILASKKLFMVQTIPFFNVTRPLWSAHPSGHLQDCTHFCW